MPTAPEKTIGPNKVLSFPGIELDTCKSEARLPQEKESKGPWFARQIFEG